jgi:hypothetical protein
MLCSNYLLGYLHVLDKIKDTGRVPGLVIVPRHKLDKVVGKSDTSLLVKDGSVGIRDKVGRDNVLVLVSEDALHLAFRRLLDGGADGLVRGTVLETARQVNDRHVDDRDTERHTSELSVEFGDDLSDSLGGTGARRDDVVACRASSTPVLLGGTIDSLLGGSDSCREKK